MCCIFDLFKGRRVRPFSIVVKVFCVELGRGATGSPQPPPGGGLLLYVADPSARLRAFFCKEAIAQRLAGRSRPRAEARNSFASLRPPQACSPKMKKNPLILNFES